MNNYVKRIILTFLILTTTILLVACQNGNGENNNGNDKYNLEPAPGCLVPYLDGGWVCTWADEFKLDQVDPFKWNFEINDSGGGNNELQYYIKDNATVKDGILTITGKHETFRTRQYTSSRITTHRKGDFRYGRIQIRAKNPVGRGTWPAIWMMPTRSIYGGWPRSGEIDIMEYVGYDPSKIHTTIHTAKFNHKLGTQIGKSMTMNSTNDFHVYELEWNPGELIWKVDGKQVFNIVYNAKLNDDVPYWEAHPFDQEFYLILNLAIGGDWGGAKGVDNKAFPTYFQIDYVRYYQRDFEKVDKKAPTKVEYIYKSRLANTIHWDKATDDYGVSHYKILVDGEEFGQANLQQFTFKNLDPGDYMIEIIAVDFTGKESEISPKFQYKQQ